MMESKKGNFSFVAGNTAYSSAVAAAPGYEIVHCVLSSLHPYRRGFGEIDRHLQEQGRPAQALCGIELRSRRPLTFEEFNKFNRGYAELLKARDIFVDGINPVARTNVAPELNPPPEASLYAFSYTVAAKQPQPTFVVSGAGDVGRGAEKGGAGVIIRQGDVSADAMREKADHVLGLVEKRMSGLSVDWAQVTSVDVYTVQNIFPLMQEVLLPRIGQAGIQGIRWHFARPPIRELEFEMSVHGCRHELYLRR